MKAVSSSDSDLKSKIQELEKQIQQLKARKGPKRKGNADNIECFRCREVGHYASDCTNPKKEKKKTTSPSPKETGKQQAGKPNDGSSSSEEQSSSEGSLN